MCLFRLGQSGGPGSGAATSFLSLSFSPRLSSDRCKFTEFSISFALFRGGAKQRGRTRGEKGNKISFEFRLGKKDVPLHLRVVLDECQLPRQRPRVLSLDVEGAGAGRGEELDEERGSLFGAGHFFPFSRGVSFFSSVERAAEGNRLEESTTSPTSRRDLSLARALLAEPCSQRLARDERPLSVRA